MVHGRSWYNKSLQDRQWAKIEEETYRWLVCSWSLLSCAGCEPERRSRQMAWRAATSRANPWRATLGSATRAFSPRDQQVPREHRPLARWLPTQCSPCNPDTQDREQGYGSRSTSYGVNRKCKSLSRQKRVKTAAQTSTTPLHYQNLTSASYNNHEPVTLRAKASLQQIYHNRISQ